MFQKVQSSGVKLASLLPVEFRSHEALAELMESKVHPFTIRHALYSLFANYRYGLNWKLI